MDGIRVDARTGFVVELPTAVSTWPSGSTQRFVAVAGFVAGRQPLVEQHDRLVRARDVAEQRLRPRSRDGAVHSSRFGIVARRRPAGAPDRERVETGVDVADVVGVEVAQDDRDVEQRTGPDDRADA